MYFKKSLLTLALFASITTHAGSYQCKKGDISLPCEMNAWELGGDALYFSETSNILPNHFNSSNQIWSMGYNWGLRIEASRHFGQGTDFNINWAYFKSSQNFIDNLPNAAPGAGTVGGLFPGANTPFTNSDYMSIVNLELGQEVNFGDNWHVRLHAGLQVDNLQGQMQSIAAGTLNTAKSNAVGPRAGVDVAYQVWNQFSFYTNAAIAALYSATSYSGPDVGFASTVRGLNHNWTRSEGITEIDYNIGLQYTQNVSRGDLTGRVGWTSYNFNISQTISAWQGLIFGMKWLGSV